MLVEAKVLRLTSHSSDDDQRRYRAADELAAEKERDCVARFRSQLEDLGVLTSTIADDMRTDLTRELDRAEEEAEAAPLPEPETAMRHVFGEAAEG